MNHWANWFRIRSRRLCESWRFCVLTTVLTLYALFGDDFRLAATHQAIDNFFNFLTIFCILVFSMEVVAASLGKEEYFLGFFFLLDVGATVTLFFDLTWVWNELACGGAEMDTEDTETDSSGGALKTSRAGRAGARAARTVRIIRLLRLVKLYKTYKTALEHKGTESFARRWSMEPTPPGGKLTEGGDEDAFLREEEDLIKEEEDADDDAVAASKQRTMGDVNAPGQQSRVNAETRVGRKLSDMTTRRVIILVLVMLFVMPLFAPSQYGYADFRSSGDMGAELIYDRFRAWCLQPNGTHPDAEPWCLQALRTPDDAHAQERYSERAWYEEYLLEYIYHHQDADFAWKLYWIGFNSATLASKGIDMAGYLGELAQLNQHRFLGPYAQPPDGAGASVPPRIDLDPTPQVDVSVLPSPVRRKLIRPWIEKCSDFYGVSVAQEVDSEHPSVCSVKEELRCSEVQMHTPLTKTEREDKHLTMMFVFDIRETTQLAASLSIVQTIFICFAVGLGAMSFSSDANKLLLKPIERMISKMETIKDNPLEAMKLGDKEFRKEEIQADMRREQLANMNACWKWFYMSSMHFKRVKEPMETVILEKTIIKLGGLLALGFGEAGAEVIGANMRGGHSAGVNAMVPGSKVDAITGFCHIRNFGDATEVLKEKVMVFVNQIGEIVHGCVDDFHGAPNRNIGDTFLLVWRLSGVSPERQTKLADMAILSFTRIVAEINKSRVLAVYRDHPGLLQRIPKYRVQMGFGLHCGWAIEGAIGSEFKIDASYLSPNVNVASRLEAATEQLGVWILISHFMINLCSPEFAQLCRLIDHVTVKGSKQSVRLYTIDLDCNELQVQPRKVATVIKNRFRIRQIREVRKNEKWADDYKVWEAFDTDEDLIAMRSLYSTEFFQRFAMGYRNYEAGEWMVAHDALCMCHYMQSSSGNGDSPTPTILSDDQWPVDGPTCTLLNFMKQFNYVPPNDWPGHRELTSK